MSKNGNNLVVYTNGIERALESRDIGRTLPASIPRERFMNGVRMAIHANPKIADAPAAQVIAACLSAAKDGLIPDGKEAALVPFRSKSGPQVQYIPMVAGLMKRMRNAPETQSIMAQLVREGDEFDYRIEDGRERLTHRPQIFGDRGAVVGAYAVLATKTGGIYIKVLAAEDLEKRREVSKQKGAGPWSDWRDEMYLKTAIRALAKIAPSAADIVGMEEHAAIAADEAPQETTPNDVADEAPPKTRAQMIAESAKFDEPEDADIIDEETGEVMSEDQDAPI